MNKFVRFIFKTVKWIFIVFLIYVLSLFFREERLPASWVTSIVQSKLPTNLVFSVDSVSFGFASGLHINGLVIYDTARKISRDPLVKAKSISIRYFFHQLTIDELYYPYLPDSYYAPENLEKNAPVEATLPKIDSFVLTLIRPNILGVRAEKVVADIECTARRFSAERIHLDWPDQDEPMMLNGFCYVDLGRQEVRGEVVGSARQSHIRPLLEHLDVPSALPYMDSFTDVPGKIPSRCGWQVNLINNDFDLFLKLNPTMGKYNLVPMKTANGDIHLHIYTRGTSLNYHQIIGPIVGVGIKDEPLEGTVTVDGTNGYNTVDVVAKSAMPVANLLKIGGFTGEYVGNEVVGKSSCKLQFRFPRAMTNNYEVMDGFGHIKIEDGQIMRMKGFKGLVELLADRVPGVSWFTDSTQASCDYVIDKGVIKAENIYIEGSVFSIYMYGSYNCVRDELDFTVRVQFTKKDSLAGKILHPLTWPFTKLLLEFRLTGTSENPMWKYVSVVDRVMEVTK